MTAPLARKTAAVMAAGMALLASSNGANAQEAPGTSRVFSIPRGPAAQTIAAFTRQADVNVLASTRNLDGIVTNAVEGSYPVPEALARLLAGTGLTGRVNPNGSVFIMAPAATPGPVAAREGEEVPAGWTIVVTGSRLASRGYQAASPVTVLDARDFTLSGAQTTETLLVQSPQFLGNVYGAAGNGGSMGVAALNLRGLGEQRSLTLVNGRRYTVTGTDSLTDLNTIPAALVKRVEIVTGGSSAVYGSNAVAGVVNFILRNDVRGVEVQADTKRDARTGTAADAATLTMGGRFHGERGSAVVSLDWYRRGGILRGQFPWAAQGLADGCVTADSFSIRGPGVPLAVPAGATCTGAGGRAGFVAANSAATEAGRFFGIPTWGSAASSPGLDTALAAAGLRDMTSYGITFDAGSNAARAARDPQDRYNNTPVNYMQTPLRRVMANSFVDYRVDPRATLYGETHLSSNVSRIAIAPGGVSNYVLVDTDNPYLSGPDREVLRQLDLLERGATTINQGTGRYTTVPGDGRAILGINRRNSEAGSRTSTLERTAFRTVLGVKGDAFADLRYDLYYSYARTRLTERQGGNFSLSRWQASMLSVDGTPPLLNPFGAGTLSPAALQAVSVDTTHASVNTQQVAAGNLGGTLATLPAGPLDVDAGFEWRDNRIAVMPDALGSSGDLSGQGTLLPVRGGTSVRELYGEVRVPLLKDAPLARRLALNGAMRFSSYSLAGLGGVWTHSLGLQWQPVQDVSLRIQGQRALRAPNIGELYSPRNALSPVLNDPCSSRAPAAGQTAALRALCVATGVPEDAVFTSGLQPNTPLAALGGGNPRLGPETARTVTLGMVYTPAAVANLAFSVDVYRIDLDGAIAPIGGNVQNLFDLCYGVLADPDSPYCRAIRRDAAGTLNGGDGYVDQSLDNTGGIRVSGVDLNAQYGFGVPFAPFGGDSRIDASTNWSYTREYTFTPVQAMPDLKNRCAGAFGTVCGAPAPRWKGTARIAWRNGPLTLSLHARHTGAVTRDVYLLPLRQGKVPPALADVPAGRIRAQRYLDMAFALALPAGVELYGGVNNVFDRDPPLLGSGAATWGLGTAPGVYEIYGRSLFFGLKKRL